jgi:hypothetical protein
VRGFLESWWGAFDQAVIEVDEIIDAGEAVVVVFHARVRGRESGAEADGPGAVQVWAVRDGLASSLTLYQGRAEALEAVGLERKSRDTARADVARERGGVEGGMRGGQPP